MTRKKMNGFSILRIIMLIFFVLLALLPFLVLPIVSFKTKVEFMMDPLALPKSINFDNYVTIFKSSKIIRSFFNSFIITAGSIIVELFVGSLAAYALTKMNFKHSGRFTVAFMIPMVFPIQTITIPIYIIFRKIGLLNSYAGMIIIYAAIGLPIVIFMMTSFMKTIPIQISESAVLDGAGDFTIFRKLILPLLKPVTSTITVICGLAVWNDFYMPMIMLTNADKKTLPLIIYDFMGKYTSDWTLICTCIILIIVPIMILYIFLQKNIIGGIVAGSLKG